METRIKHRLEALERAARLARQHPVALARATQLVAAIDDIVVQIRRCDADQDSGRSTYRSGAAIRAHRAEELLDLLRPINRIARTVNREEYPGLRQKLKMPRGDGYERLLASAAAFIEAAGAIREVFIERGLDEDFIEQIAAKREELLAAASIKYSGQRQQVGGTAGLAALARRGMQLLRELDAILTHRYRNDPALLAAWRSAVRVQRDPERVEDESESRTEGTASIAPSTPMAAVAGIPLPPLSANDEIPYSSGRSISPPPSISSNPAK